MRLVIDSNLLDSACLESFLSKTEQNIAVIPDYVAMEMFKKIQYKVFKIAGK